MFGKRCSITRARPPFHTCPLSLPLSLLRLSLSLSLLRTSLSPSLSLSYVPPLGILDQGQGVLIVYESKLQLSLVWCSFRERERERERERDRASEIETEFPPLTDSGSDQTYSTGLEVISRMGKVVDSLYSQTKQLP